MVNLLPSPPDRLINYQIPPEAVKVLSQTAWCADLLDDPSFTPIASHSRNPGSATHLQGRYTFMKTWSTPETIPIWQGFYRPSAGEGDYGEVRVVVGLGSDLDGHLHTAHGGLAAAVLDECMGTVGGIHKTPGKSQFTAYLHVNYKKPLPTPSVILIKAKIDPTRSGGRKMYINATLENGEGVVYNTADGLFLEVDRKSRPKI